MNRTILTILITAVVTFALTAGTFGLLGSSFIKKETSSDKTGTLEKSSGISWERYRSKNLDVRLNYPAKSFAYNPCTESSELVPTKVVEEGNQILLFQEYRYEQSDEQGGRKNCRKVENKIEDMRINAENSPELDSNTFPFRSAGITINVGNAKNTAELDGFVKKIFGKGCKTYMPERLPEYKTIIEKSNKLQSLLLQKIRKYGGEMVVVESEVINEEHPMGKDCGLGFPHEVFYFDQQNHTKLKYNILATITQQECSFLLNNVAAGVGDVCADRIILDSLFFGPEV